LLKNLQHPAIRRDVVVYRERLADEAAVLNLEDGTEAVRVDLVRAEEPKVSRIGVARVSVTQHLAQAPGGLAVLLHRRLVWDRPNVTKKEVGRRT
jgi:hypothetical protein